MEADPTQPLLGVSHETWTNDNSRHDIKEDTMVNSLSEMKFEFKTVTCKEEGSNDQQLSSVACAAAVVNVDKRMIENDEELCGVSFKDDHGSDDGASTCESDVSNSVSVSGDEGVSNDEEGRAGIELEDLRLQNKSRLPYRDLGVQLEANQQGVIVFIVHVYICMHTRIHIHTRIDALDAQSKTTTSYLQNKEAVKILVKRGLEQKRKGHMRQNRPKREGRAPLASGRRSKKSNRHDVKHTLDVGIF